ncbi:MAG TPA: hypothetical protein DCQ92_15755 [Verrucomicrobia subdivision 3 bacterium]|nr:hypothetical protein [Limisphaerales bacterium]
MIAQGAIFSRLRVQMLDAIPENAVASFQNKGTLGDWLNTGTFVVTSCTRREVLIEASPIDYGGVVLTECENLLNHCFEHLQEMVCLTSDERIRSNAWGIVTAYYFGFFSASAFLRLVGQPVVFLTTEQLRRLMTLAGSTEKPGQGAFHFQITNQISVTRAELAVRQTDKIHESTWKTALGCIDELNRDPSLTKSAAEANFYDTVCSRFLFTRYNNFHWPSMIRNRANYRPGFAYRLHSKPLNFSQSFDVWRKADHADIHRILQNCLRKCNANADEFVYHANLMLNVGTAFFLLARALYAELLARRKTDRRWETQRTSYCRQMKVPAQEFKLLLEMN